MTEKDGKIDLGKIEKKWQKRWEEVKIFEAEPMKDKPKFFMIFAYPGVSGYLHVGHMRGYTYTDVITRYKKMKGFNVLFPVGTHATGNIAYAFLKKIKENNKEWIEYLKLNGATKEDIKKMTNVNSVVDFFNKVYINDYWKRFGFLADWRRFTCTIYPEYNRFIEWQFKKLKEKNLLVKKPYYATFCVNCGPIAVDPSQTDISKGGDAEKYEFIFLKFKIGEEYIIAATLRPETVYGQTNLWVDPNVVYEKVKIGEEIWIVSKECAEKLKYQKDNIEIVGKVRGKDLIGKYAIAPGIKKEIIILPSKFCDTKVGSGIVTSVPSDAPYDWMALKDLQENEAEIKKYGLDSDKIKKIKPIPIIKSEKWGDLPAIKICEEMKIKNQTDSKLEEATKEIYKKGFHTGIMNENCGKFDGMNVEEAKERMKQDLIESGEANVFYDLSEEVLCRCGGKVIIKRVEDQWFIKYSDQELTEKSKEQVKKMNIYPEEYKETLPSILDWFQDRACVRMGNWLGTKFPFDEKWIIEPISDSTLYPAFYIVSKYVNSGELKVSDLTEEFFDFIFLGKGKPKNKIWNGVREDFEYWYPLDINLGGKEHKTVHFPVFLMNHVAVMNEKDWPKGIFVNWWVTQKGKEKITKSKGGAEPIPEAAKTYSVDGIRLYYCHIASPFADVEWDPENVFSYKNNIIKFYNLVETIKKADEEEMKNVDKWLLSSLNSKLKDATKYFDEFNVRKSVDILLFEIMRDFLWYQKRDGNNKKIVDDCLKIWIKTLSPVIPHVCEELWEKLGNKPFISTTKWPEADESKINLEAELGEELLKKIMEDVEEIKKIAKIEKPEKITIFVAPQWKYEVYKGIKEGKQIGDFMKKDKYKRIGKDLVGYVQTLMKKKPLGNILNYEKEVELLKGEKGFLKKETKMKVEIIESGESEEKKAKQAEPMKPGILIE